MRADLNNSAIHELKYFFYRKLILKKLVNFSTLFFDFSRQRSPWKVHSTPSVFLTESLWFRRIYAKPEVHLWKPFRHGLWGRFSMVPKTWQRVCKDVTKGRRHVVFTYNGWPFEYEYRYDAKYRALLKPYFFYWLLSPSKWRNVTTKDLGIGGNFYNLKIGGR